MVSESDREPLEERVARLEQRDERLTRALELLAREPVAKPARSWDAYAAVIASLIGILALVVGGYTAYLQRQQLRAQMWPHVQLEFSGVNLTYSALNRGTGPARVTAMRMTVGGAMVHTWREVETVARFTGDEGFASSWLSQTVLSAGQVFTLIEPRNNDASRAKFKDLLPGHPYELAITVCYCSVLDECWMASTSVDAWPADRCTIPEAERFVQ